jgi:DNA polymerase-3 subunit gamma/tau
VSSRYKVYIVDEAHMVTTQGFNALLKVVEEPPDFLVFVFATTEPEKVLPTIRSRTHHYPFRLVPPTTLRVLLEKTCDAEGVTVEPTVFPLVVRAGGGSVRDSLSILDQLLAGAGPEGVTYKTAVGLLGVTDDALLDETIDALAAHDAPAVFRAVDRVVEAGHDPRRFATDLLDRLRDLIVLDAVPDAGGNGLLDCPPDRLDLMNQQASALGSATLSRMADTVHEGLTEMRGTTAPRLLLELVCARMLLPATDGSAAATLQRLERLERRMSIAGEHAGRPGAETAVREAPVPPVREAPRAAPAPAPAPAQAPAPDPVPPAAETAPAPATEQGGARRGYVRPSQARVESPAAPRTPAASAPAPAGDDWPETVQPGAGRSKQAAAPAAPAADRTPPRAAGEPDIPLPPEPTDDEDWPHAASPAAGRAAAARTEAAEHGTPAAGGPPRAAAESSPAPRGGEPTPVVSANPESAGDDGELTTTDVRRMWPELLAVVKRHKRTTEALLKNAQVHQLSNGVLTLATSSPALARRLGDDLNKDVIREALNELLGVRWRVDAVVEGAAAAAGPAVPPEQAREAARAAEAAEASELMAERAADVSAAADGEPEPVVDPEQAALSLLRAQLGARPVDS